MNYASELYKICKIDKICKICNVCNCNKLNVQLCNFVKYFMQNILLCNSYIMLTMLCKYTLCTVCYAR